MKRELDIFFTGLSFFTRVPFPKWAQFKKEYQHEAIKYFPVSGIIIGSVAGLVFYLTNLVFPFNLSVMLSMGATVLFTGALHEDGFMDVCDGFGGGWTRERILEIMKDSLIGAFGVTGIVFLVMTKFFCQYSISANELPIILIAAHSVSRMFAASLVNTHQYARTENSKAKDYSQKLSKKNLIFMLLTGVLPIALLGNAKFFLVLLPVFLAKFLLGKYFKKWIGGFTGDCIGATQQVCEIVFYLSYMIIYNQAL
ncbi:adenosylcobinamide-GDP ribazoletransferase [Labilibaculum sp.]|uniref:adenosylcobinamide-GDP ribazoletransferase n=1 Tax=Labilibaculum sp. TaxID=2060723 RepID=UPI003567C322